MSNQRREFIDKLALGLCTLAFLFWVGLLTCKYYSLGYYDWDLAMYAQVMWNLKHGSLHSSLMGMNFLGNHAEFIAFLILPLYIVLSHPLTLVFLKVFSHVLGGFVLYQWAKKNIPPIGALILMILFLSFPANIFALLYEFHFESLNVGLLFLMFYFFQTQKFLPFCLSLVMTSLIKENMPPIIVAFGIYALFSKRKDKWRGSLVPIFWGAFIFCTTMFWITPLIRTSDGIPSANQYVGLYSSLGSTPMEIMKTFVFHPEKIIGVILQPYNLHYLRELLAPLLFLPVFSPHILFLALPVFLQHLLSSAPQQKTIFYHYAATLTPFLFLAAVQSLKFIYAKFKPFFYYVLLSMLVLNCTLNLSLSRENIVARISPLKNHLAVPQWQMVQEIPKDAGVIATLSFLAELSQREHAYSFLDIVRNTRGLSGQPFGLAPEVSYALIDFEDGWIKDEIFRSSNSKKALRRMQAFLNEGWSVESAAGHTVLFKRKKGNKNPLIERYRTLSFPNVPPGRDPAKAVTSVGNPDVGPPTTTNGSPRHEGKTFGGDNFGIGSNTSITIDDKIIFWGCEIARNPSKRSNVLPLTFYWKAKQTLNENYFLIIRLKQEDKTIVSKTRRIGYTIFPTNSWQKDDYIQEHYWLLLPKLPSGEYFLEVNFYNDTGKEIKNNVLKVGKITIGSNIDHKAPYAP